LYKSLEKGDNDETSFRGLAETEKVEKGEEQSQGNGRHSLRQQEEFVLAGQTVDSAYYCGDLRRLRANVRRLRPELWREKSGMLHTTTHLVTLPFLPGKFWPKRT
jgi:hypothetical protein